MLKTKPIIMNKGLGCTKAFVRFKDPKRHSIFHHLGDSLGSSLMLLSHDSLLNMIEVAYINQGGMLLKTVSYAREDVLELTLDESVCEVESVQSTR